MSLAQHRTLALILLLPLVGANAQSTTAPAPRATTPPTLTGYAGGQRASGPQIATIEFSVRHPEWKDDGPSPYVSVDDPARDIRFMDAPTQIVLESRTLTVMIDYPTTGEWSFQVQADTPKGFTRAGLAIRISQIYHAMYDEEARTSKVKVVPPDERKGIANRNRTTGKYGIWGHDIGDLALSTVEIHRAPDGTFYAVLLVDS